MEKSTEDLLAEANKKLSKLEAQVDGLKEVILQMAWELEMRHKHVYITKKEEEFLQNRRKG